MSVLGRRLQCLRFHVCARLLVVPCLQMASLVQPSPARLVHAQARSRARTGFHHHFHFQCKSEVKVK